MRYLSRESVNKKLRYDKYNRIVLGAFPDAYLVGGYIRDSIIGRHSLDRDYVVNISPVEAVKSLRDKLGGTVVIFRDRETARLVLKNGLTLDFSKCRNSIEEDLHLRDFTVNSIGYNNKRGIIDPVKGLRDIVDGRLRTLRKENLMIDPLRCLRAYRFYGELGWKIERKTRNLIALVKNKLNEVAPERITFEFCRMISGKYAENALRESFKDSILSGIISNNISLIGSNIDKMVEVRRFIKNLPDNIRRKMERKRSQDLRAIEIILLEALLRGIELDALRLKFSNIVMNRIRKANLFLSKYNGKSSRADLFDHFCKSEEMVYDLVCLTGKRELIETAQRFLHIMKHKIVPVEKIIEMTSFKGEKVGQVIRGLRRERFLGRIRTRSQAVEFIRKWCHEAEII